MTTPPTAAAPGPATPTPATRARLADWYVRAWALALAAVLLWPQRRGGYGLGHDMVFTPHQPLDAAALGVGSASPRAVPVDALVALAEHVVNGAVVGRLGLLAPLLLAGLGAARLLEDSPTPARLAACGVAVWNPYVVERLALGQWSLLWGYAALPWVVRAAAAHRRRELPPRALWRLVAPLAVASVTPTGGLLAVLIVLAVVLRPGTDAGARRAAVPALVLALLAQAPWLAAAALGSAAGTSDPSAVAAFAARSEFGGVAVSLLGLGGVWDADVAPASRGGALTLVTAAVVVAAVVLGRGRVRRRLGGAAWPLTVGAAAGFVLAVAATVPGLDAVLRWVVGDVPGGGLLRDAQKWLAPLVVLAAVSVGACVEALLDRVGRVPVAAAGVLVAALVGPVVLLPDATTTLWPTVTPVHYPAGYARAARLVDGDVAVVPFQPYRAFRWAGGRIALDPAARLLPGTVVTSDRLPVGGRTLAGEDPRAARVGRTLAAHGEVATGLARAGIRWLLVERQTPGDLPPVTGLRLVLDDPAVRLYRVPGRIRALPPSTPRVVVAAVVLATWTAAALAAVVLWLLSAGAGVRASRRRRHAAQPAHDLEGQPDR